MSSASARWSWVIGLAMSATLSLATPTPVRAQSLLANGFFDGSIAPWMVAFGTASLNSANDADEHPNSGSAHLVAAPDLDPGARAVLMQCTSVTEGHSYFLAGKLAFTSGETAVGWAGSGFEFRSASGCNGNGLGFDESLTRTTQQGRGNWQEVPFGDFTGGATAPKGAKSALVYVYLSRTNGLGGSLSIDVDDLTFAPVGVPLCRGFAATMFGTSGPDTLVGTPSADVIVGLNGDDTIYGKGGVDIICGGPGKDTLYGGGGGDYLDGGDDDDVLRGGPGKDVLIGGVGSDRLYGGSGDDLLAGGRGYDFCYPGHDDDPSERQCDSPIILFP